MTGGIEFPGAPTINNERNMSMSETRDEINTATVHEITNNMFTLFERC